MAYPFVLVFSRTANGDVAPFRMIVETAPPLGVFVDTVHDELMVSTAGAANRIDVYARTADGAATPLRAIAGGDANLTGSVSPGITQQVKP